MRLVIGVLVSGSGSNLQSIMDAVKSGYIPDSKVAAVISNKKDAYALERAKEAGIDAIFLDPPSFPDSEAYNDAVADEFIKRNVNMVCLAGYLLMVKGRLLKEFKGRMLNIHPALLPKFGGKGMYGRQVHEAIIKSKEKKSGATVHVVDEVYDHGPIVIQRTVDVDEGETPESLAAKVLKIEHKIFPEALKIIAEGKIVLDNTLSPGRERE